MLSDATKGVMRELAPGVWLFPTLIANAFVVGDRDSWVLVDSCKPGHERSIRRAVEERFGVGTRPRSIVLTHGHSDHTGSAAALAGAWNVPIYAHERELPYVNGEKRYPPFDYSMPGFFTRVARFMPVVHVNLEGRARAFPVEPLPGLERWRLIETPGHTFGHVSLYRPEDGVLLAGDALTTMNLDTLIGTLGRRRAVCRPPALATLDWEAARESMRRMAALRPTLIACAHGLEMRGAADALSALAARFPMP